MSKRRVAMDPAKTFRRLVPADRLAASVTPSDDVYVIAHMGIARVDVGEPVHDAALQSARGR
jgi:hypothetical protein